MFVTVRKEFKQENMPITRKTALRAERGTYSTGRGLGGSPWSFLIVLGDVGWSTNEGHRVSLVGPVASVAHALWFGAAYPLFPAHRCIIVHGNKLPRFHPALLFPSLPLPRLNISWISSPRLSVFLRLALCLPLSTSFALFILYSELYGVSRLPNIRLLFFPWTASLFHRQMTRTKSL